GTGPQQGLKLLTNVTLNGVGLNGVGALYSHGGINLWNGTITLNPPATPGPIAIGVDPDPHPSSDKTYFTHDYSLTVNGIISGGQLEKTGLGQLILPQNNTYTGGTLINQGWITIQSGLALGGRAAGMGDTAQPTTVVADGAALHLKPLGNLSLAQNLVLTGMGIVHPYGLISQKGALMNLNGDNVLGSAVIGGVTSGSTIQLSNIAGIGVEALGPSPVSNLTIAGPIADSTGTTGGGFVKLGSLRLTLQGPGSYSG